MSGWWLASYLVLWALLAASVVVLLVVLRQLGLVYLRLHEGTAEIVAEDGPALGSAIEPLGAVDGEALTPFRFPDPGFGLNLITFVSSECRFCKSALEELPSAVNAKKVHVVVASDRFATGSDDFREALGNLATFVAEKPLRSRLRINRVPFALVTDGNGIVLSKGVVNTADDFAELVTQAQSHAAI